MCLKQNPRNCTPNTNDNNGTQLAREGTLLSFWHFLKDLHGGQKLDFRARSQELSQHVSGVFCQISREDGVYNATKGVHEAF